MAEPSDSGKKDKKAKKADHGSGKALSAAEELERFDLYYGKKGRVYVFPDVKEPKVKAYQKRKERQPNPEGTSGTASGTETKRERGKKKRSTGQPKPQDMNSTTDKETNQKAKPSSGEAKPNESHTTTDSSSAKAPEQRPGDSGKKLRIKEPDLYVLNMEKLEESTKTGQVQGEEGELVVIEKTRAALETITGHADPPVFLLHNQQLGRKKNVEIDVLVLHPALGALILEVKATGSTWAFPHFDAAATQLLRARELIQEEMGDLLESDAIALTLALPNLQPDDVDVIREEIKDRKAQKKKSGAKVQPTPSVDEAVVTSVTGTAEQAVKPSSASDTGHDVGASTTPSAAPPVSLSAADVTAPSSTSRKAGQQGDDVTKAGKGDTAKKIEHLEDHPEINLLCGSIKEVYTEWVKLFQQPKATASYAFKGSTDEERLNNFKFACIRRCSAAGLRPGQSVKDSADLHRRFLLTEEQLRVRDSKAELLHISGPYGSGKTLLLAERARRWVRKGLIVGLAVGNPYYSMLLRHLAHSVCGEADVPRVFTFNKLDELAQWLGTVSADDPAYIIVDELDLSLVYDSFSINFQGHVKAGRIRGLWSASAQPLHDAKRTKWERSGGSVVELSLCLRCPQHILEWTESLKEDNLPMRSPPVPVTRELGVGVEVISHADHPQSQPWKTCGYCRKKARAFFSRLGLLGKNAKSVLKLSDVVVLITSPLCDKEQVAAWLRRLGLHAVAETNTWMYSTPVLPPGVKAQSREDAKTEAQRHRLLSGVDVDGDPVIHVATWDDFQGLEKPVVVLWHEDWWDLNSSSHQSEDWWDVFNKGEEQGVTTFKISDHANKWFFAASRCQGRMLVMAVTPSPLLSLLPATIPPTSSASSASLPSAVTSASQASPASHHSVTKTRICQLLDAAHFPRETPLATELSDSEETSHNTELTSDSPEVTSHSQSVQRTYYDIYSERYIPLQMTQEEALFVALEKLARWSVSSDPVPMSACPADSLHSTPSNVSLGGESNLQPSTPPEEEEIYRRCTSRSEMTSNTPEPSSSLLPGVSDNVDPPK